MKRFEVTYRCITCKQSFTRVKEVELVKIDGKEIEAEDYSPYLVGTVDHGCQIGICDLIQIVEGASRKSEVEAHEIEVDLTETLKCRACGKGFTQKRTVLLRDMWKRPQHETHRCDDKSTSFPTREYKRLPAV